MSTPHPGLPYQLDRAVTIEAEPETIFRFFTDSARWAAWWGEGSSIEPRPGGKVVIRYPNAVVASGEVLELAAPARLVFSFGYQSGVPFGPGASRVTIELLAIEGGTRLQLTHRFAEAAARDQHAQGWRYQLSLFANRICDEVQAQAAARIDGWFAAWAERDPAAREAKLAAVAAPGVEFRDRFSRVAGLADLSAQIGAVQQFMPGAALAREGEVRHCQGTALADWAAKAPDGAPRGRGVNVFSFDHQGRITRVTGFWA